MANKVSPLQLQVSNMSLSCIYFPDDQFGERNVLVNLEDKESELVFIDHPTSEMSVGGHLIFTFTQGLHALQLRSQLA